jgi:hypothetical protein
MTHEPTLLEAVANLSRFHRDHEKFYASAPREQAVALQRHSRVLLALADRWSTTTPEARDVLSPFEGAEDLNDEAALQFGGVLFMEGEGTPVEIERLIRDLRVTAEDLGGSGEWLATAMASSWAVAIALAETPELADLLGERHRIIANDWQAADMSGLAARLLVRAADLLDHVDFSPTALRADLAAGATAPKLLWSAVELMDHAADLLSDSAGLVHENERRWRVFRARVGEILAAAPPPP